MIRMIIASACLLGINCRWNGNSSPGKKLLPYLPDVIPVCPEQLGGLATPRDPAQIIDGNGLDVLNGQARVINSAGNDVTCEFIRGANAVLRIAKLYKAGRVILKERSPSCAAHHIYHGETLTTGMGVTCALLIREGFAVLSSEEIEKFYV